jgi:pimeloyl-ACP methyl ester carboxylesterase
MVASAPVVDPDVRSVNQLDDASRYQAIEAPTLLLLGTESAEHPFQDTTRALAEAMPNASVAMLEGQRHLATLYAPHLVIDAIRSFATSTPRC